MPPSPSPQERGYTMPAEWTPHAATWMAWPSDDTLWVGQLEPVRRDIAGLVTAIARAEPVHLLVCDEEAERDAAARIGSANVDLHRLPYDDVWLRDSGPIAVTRGDRVRLLNWEFNGWGGKYEAARDNAVPIHVARLLGSSTLDTGIVLEGGSIDVNGAGVVLTTRQCLLSPHRNPQLTEPDLEAWLRTCLGVRQVLWLDEGLEGDHTDGHIDTIARFVDERTIVAVSTDDRSDPNYDMSQANLDRLRSAADADGRPFTVVELPLPRTRLEFEGERLPPTYANFYVVNGAVLVPMYGDPHDALALDVLRPLFPRRRVEGLMARGLITGGGAFHCVTQQIPVGILVNEL